MIPRWYARSYAFTSPEAGFDYFLTETHYRSLADRIIATLGGFSVVVVTGDPAPIPQILSTALTGAAASHHTVIGFSCGPELGRDELLRACRGRRDAPASNGSTYEDPLQFSPAPLVFVFDDSTRLSDEQIEEIFEIIHLSKQRSNQQIAGAVLLAAPEFLARLERPVLRLWLAERLLVARLRFQELGADEVAAFIRHQLPAGEAERALTNETINAITNVSGGDPALVNRFSRRLLDFSASNATKNLMKPAVGPSAAEPIEPPIGKRDVATLDEPSRDAVVPEPARDLRARLWIQVWRGLNATVRISVVVVVCLVFFGGIGAFFTHSAEETVSTFGALIGKVSVTGPESETSVSEAARPGPAVAASAVQRPVADLTGSPEKLMPPAIPNPPASLAGARPTAVVASPAATLEANPTSVTPAPITQAARLLPSSTEITALIAQGDRSLGTGDVTSARLFYERAADVGDGEAALKLAKTFDPAFLRFGRLSGVRGDLIMAIPWYRRARDLGRVEAEIQLKRLYQESFK